MLRFKEGVSVRGARTEMHIGMQCAASVYAHYGLNCTVTSVVDGRHSRGSLHYRGDAFDLRIKDILNDEGERDMDLIREIVEVLADALPQDFDVVLESTHIHVEFQPKH